MVYEPPPNADDWISDAFPSREVSRSVDDARTEPERYEEQITWTGVMAARRFAHGRHAGEPGF